MRSNCVCSTPLSSGHTQPTHILYSSADATGVAAAAAAAYRPMAPLPIANTNYPAHLYTGSSTTSNSISRYGTPLSHISSNSPTNYISTTSPQSTYQGSGHRPTLYSQYPVQFIQPYISQRPSAMAAPTTTTEPYSQHIIPRQWTPSYPWPVQGSSLSFLLYIYYIYILSHIVIITLI